MRIYSISEDAYNIAMTVTKDCHTAKELLEKLEEITISIIRKRARINEMYLMLDGYGDLTVKIENEEIVNISKEYKSFKFKLHYKDIIDKYTEWRGNSNRIYSKDKILWQNSYYYIDNGILKKDNSKNSKYDDCIYDFESLTPLSHYDSNISTDEYHHKTVLHT